MKYQSAFTLIELLVVIAIVGILAGILVLSMTNATNQATIAKAKVFSNSIRDSMAQTLVSEWNFDELTSAINGQVIKDSWGSNNGTLRAGTGDTNNKMFSNCISEKCLLFDGIDDYISISHNQNLSFSKKLP